MTHIRLRKGFTELGLILSYETVSLGFSHWCSLFTYEEWQGFEYSLDIAFAGSIAFSLQLEGLYE